MKTMSVLLTILCLTIPVSAYAYTAVLDTFDTLNYSINQHGGGVTDIVHPQNADPGGWPWKYGGYGRPATGSRETTTVVSGAAWRFDLPADITETGNEGPAIYTYFNDPNYESRTLEQVLTDLGHPLIDWTQPVTFLVDVWGWRQAGWVRFDQGFLVFDYTPGTRTPTDYIHLISTNGAGFYTASMELNGADADGRFLLGLFFAFDRDEPAESPVARVIFDNLRIEYDPITSDVSLSKISDAPNGVLPGANLIYAITVTNTGPEAIPNGASLTIVDTLPNGVSYVSDNLGCTHDGSPTGGNVTCTLTLPTGLGVSSSTGFAITVKVVSPQGTITNQVAITDRTLFIDPNSENDSATYDVAIVVAVPTLSQWGMIMFIALTALGAVYYMRRQETAKS